jgi:hypothetical protein
MTANLQIVVAKRVGVLKVPNTARESEDLPRIEPRREPPEAGDMQRRGESGQPAKGRPWPKVQLSAPPVNP